MILEFLTEESAITIEGIQKTRERTRTSRTYREPKNFDSNHPDASVYGIVARILASRNIGVTIREEAFTTSGDLIPDYFASFATPEARPIIARIYQSPEIKVLSYVTEGSEARFAGVPQSFDLSSLDPEKRTRAARLLREAKSTQFMADRMFRKDPVEAVKYDVRALFLRAQASWILEELPSVFSLVEEVVDRELVSH